MNHRPEQLTDEAAAQRAAGFGVRAVLIGLALGLVAVPFGP